MMSGAEIFQVVGTMISIVDAAIDVIKFFQQAGEVDSHVKGLERKIKDFRKEFKTVKSLVEHRQELGGRSVSGNEQMIWRYLESSLRRSERLLEDFNNSLPKIDRHNPGRMEKAIVQFRLVCNRENIDSFERNLDAQVQAIQLWISSLQV